MRLLLIFMFLSSICLAATSNSSINFTINITEDFTTTGFNTFNEGFYLDWGPYILAILTMGLSFILSGTYSQAFLMTGVGWVFVGFIYGLPIFFIGAIVLLICGGIMKFITG